MKRRVALLLCGPLALSSGCAHVEADGPEPAAPGAAPAATPAGAPKATLHVSSNPIEALRSPYFSAFEVTFQNPSNQWHHVRHVSIAPERRLFGPALESLLGERLHTWQLAAREAHDGKQGPRHPALETLALEAPAKTASPGSEAAGAMAPASYLLAGPFPIAPGLFTRKWVVLYTAAPDALLGQDLVLSYELENGAVERALVQYPKPAPPP